MKKLLSILLALVLAAGIAAAGAVGANAVVSYGTFSDLEGTIIIAVNAWRDTYDFTARHTATIIEGGARLAIYREWDLGVVRPLEDALDEIKAQVREIMDVDGNYLGAEYPDAVIPAFKKFWAYSILRDSTFYDAPVPDSLWALVGGKPADNPFLSPNPNPNPNPNPDPQPDPKPDPNPNPSADRIFVFFIGFLPEGVANTVTWVVRNVFFGWLWGRWL